MTRGVTLNNKKTKIIVLKSNDIFSKQPIDSSTSGNEVLRNLSIFRSEIFGRPLGTIWFVLAVRHFREAYDFGIVSRLMEKIKINVSTGFK